jgi:hypothetical protein
VKKFIIKLFTHQNLFELNSEERSSIWKSLKGI